MHPLLTIPINKNIHSISINHAIKKAHVSQAMRRKLKNQGTFLCNQVPCDWNTLLHGGDILSVFLEERQSFSPYEFPLSVVYEDDYIIVVDKPYNLLVHPTSTERLHTLANAVTYYYQQTNQHSSFHPVHRLDKNTSGLIIIAKSAIVQHAFTKQHTPIYKVYQAIVEGTLPIALGTLHWPIGRRTGSIIERICTSNGKLAHTDIQVIRRYAQYTHIQCILHTGRTHQIRVHLAQLGYPLLGDDIYGGSLRHLTRHALHAIGLQFVHPMTKREVILSAPLPADMKALLIHTQ
ncbi:RluA family pseudouridine synthase [Veillonella montpellierensis]|uniref:RluA family pseudouridine synthase n=1 Tax=Veillonella montpellierensis TaxID=187328 RepID=UPI0023F83CC9|nr:RluA family pseudouridine synthase [Veillonella montpellierensis]